MKRLGNVVKDIYTGLEGVATGYSEWLYGCNRICVEVVENNEPKDCWFDEQRIEFVKSGPMEIKKLQTPKIKLGSKVKDKVTGYQGTAMARVTWLFAHPSIEIESNELNKDGNKKERYAFDETRLQVLEEEKPKEADKKERTHTSRTGGPQDDFKRCDVVSR